MTENQLEQQTNETGLQMELNVRPSAKRAKMKRILLWSSLAILIAAGGGTVYALTKNNSYSALVRDYDKNFAAIQTASNAFKTELESPSNDKKLKDLVAFYKELKLKNNFETQVKELNNNPKYASLTSEKKNYEALGMEKTTMELNDLLKDIDKLQSIIQRSENVDSEINSMETANSPTYEFYRTIEELTTKNGTLKEEMLSVVLPPQLKEAQSKFVEALTYRGKYLTETEAAHNAAVSYKWRAEQYDSIIATMNDFKQQAQKASYNYSDPFTSRAYVEADKAEKQRKSMDEKWAEQNTHKSEADAMLSKYNEMMGIASKKGESPVSQPPRPSISEERAKIFVEDYIKKSIKALKLNKFAVVEPYLDQTGKKYKEQTDYMDYLKTNGIDENLLAYEAKSVETLNDTTYKVTTFEQYDITYGDGSRKIKSFTSKYKVVKSGTSGFLINELLETNETESINK